VKIIKTGQLRLLSRDALGNPGNGPSKAPAFKPKTRSVAFASTAANLDVSDPDGAEVDVFLADIDTLAISVLVPFAKTNRAADIYDFNFTPNGAHYTYTYTQKPTPGPNTAAGGAAGSGPGFLEVGPQPGGNLTSLSSVQRIPVGNIDTDASPAEFSPDSKYWVFHTDAALLAEDTNESIDVYEVLIGTTNYKLISKSSQGVLGNSNSYHPFYSADGKYVVFTSGATNFLPAGGSQRLYAKDRGTGVIYAFDVTYGLNIAVAAAKPLPAQPPFPPQPVRYSYKVCPDAPGVTCRTYVADLGDPVGAGDSIRGGLGKDVLVGGPGNDTISGDQDNDRIFGGPGNDTMRGGAGKDVIGGGNEFDGTPGSDTVDYTGESRPIEMILHGSQPATLTIGGVAEDTVVNVENIIGGKGSDRLRGDKLANVLEGGPGTDFLWGENASTADDPNKLDLASYLHAARPADGKTGVRLNFLVGTVTGPTTGTDHLVKTSPQTADNRSTIEGVIGSPFNDVLDGSGINRARLEGAGGNDLLIGNGGGQRATFKLARHPILVNLGNDKSCHRTHQAGIGCSCNINRARTGCTTVAAENTEGEDTLRGITSISGSPFADVLKGNAARNVINSGDGPDVIVGARGPDEFNYFEALESRPNAPDRILDFSAAEGDCINLSNLKVAQVIKTGFGTSAARAARFVRPAKGFPELQVDLDSDPAPEMIIRLPGVTSFTSNQLKCTR